MASQGELAEAQAATGKAQARLVEQEREIATKEGEVASLLAADALDFAGWRIALAVLGDLSTIGEIVTAETRDCERQEAERREQWRQEYAREEQATALLRKISRRMAEKRDDAAMLEVTSLHPRSDRSEA
ncbi:MAG: hypothetical protein BGO57_01880 [Sphingomonadales bacterium 63-6]|nr:MAG: hypothetical protein BGO57_01880 [Sphingomonadales bacterium 63-6]